MIKNISLAIVLVGVFSSSLFAQLNANVPLSDPAYVYLQQLQGWQLPVTLIQGTKPFSYRDFARVYLQTESFLEDNPERQVPQPVANSLRYFQTRLQGDIDHLTNRHKQQQLHINAIDLLKIGYINYKGQSRSLADPWIDANIVPFAEYKGGRRFIEGQNMAIESGHGIALGNIFSAYYQGRFTFFAPRQSTGLSNRTDYQTLRYYFQLAKWNLKLLVGKENVVWGSGSRGHLMLSANNEAFGNFKSLPLIQLSNDLPIRLPWIFHGMGPMKFVTFISRLNQNRRDIERPYFIGLRMNFKPRQSFSFGLSHSYIVGGNNFPISYTFFDALAEYFFIRSSESVAFSIGDSNKRNIANHIMGVDFNVTLRKLRNSSFFTELYFDDLSFSIFTLSWQKITAFYSGFYIPRLTNDGRFGLRLEFTHTSRIFYTGSPPLTAGFVYKRNIMGNNLGPLGKEVFTELLFTPTEKTTWSLLFNFQNRAYTTRLTKRDKSIPDEQRYQIGGKLSHRITDSVWLHFDLRYMRINSFDHQPINKNTFYSEISFEVQNPFHRN